jgi:hypothetical protein
MNLDESMDLVITRLQRNRHFPKYQFERSIDGFLSLFIEEYLSMLYRTAVKYIAAEFPIKKGDNNQSTNVDYMLFRHGPSPAWLLVELKTDKNSVRDDQLKAYNDFKDFQMRILLRQIRDNIMPKSRQKKKYQYLLDTIGQCVPETDSNAPIVVVYITGHSLAEETKAKYQNIEWVELSQFADKLAATKHPELWKHVSKLLTFTPLP